MDYKEIYESWLSNPYFDEETKAELKAIADDDNEIKERFYQDLEFGTAVNIAEVYTKFHIGQYIVEYEQKGI